MTATPIRTVRPARPAPSVLIVRPAQVEAPAQPLPSARQTGLGLLLGLIGVVVAFAALPIALSTPLVGVVLLVLGLLLLALLLRRDSARVAGDPSTTGLQD